MQVKYTGKDPVLVVDDDLVSGVLVQELLKSLGLRVEWHDRAMSALEVVDKRPFCLVITDWFMPGMNGGLLMTKLKTQRPDLPLICISSETDKLSQEAVLQAGARAFIPKPFNKKDFYAAIERHLPL